MIIKFNKIKSHIAYLIGTFLISSIFFVQTSYAANDLLWEIIQPSYYSETTFNVGESDEDVWDQILEGSTEINFKFKKEVIHDEDGNLLCHNGPCPEECKIYDKSKDKEEICPRQHRLVKVEVGKKDPIIVKVTKLLLVLVIALSVTMILYNGMMYIIQTWQWKEWKNLMKNIALIVVGILISLFSVVIIRLIQSIPWTLDDELIENGNSTDNEILTQKVN